MTKNDERDLIKRLKAKGFVFQICKTGNPSKVNVIAARKELLEECDGLEI